MIHFPARKGRPAAAALFLTLLALPTLGPGGSAALADAALTAKASLPTVLLYPATPGDVAALVDLRTRLRLDSRVEVLTYDPESAAIQRASAETSHPEWLVSAPVTDLGRMALARALGAAFYAVVSPGRASDTTHVELVETAPAARSFDWTGTNRQFGARAIESQVADSVSHPASYAAAAPAPTVLSVPLAASAPSVFAPSPVVASVPPAAVPPEVASVPSNAPIVIPLPAAVPPVASTVPPVESTPLPLLHRPAAPLNLPVQTAQALPAFTLPPPTPVAPVTLPTRAAAGPVTLPTVQAVPLPAISLPPTAPPIPRVTVPKLPVPGTQIAALPKPALPEPTAALPPAATEPASPVTVKKPAPKAEDITAIQPLLAKGDLALNGGDAVSAIALYRQAVNGAPLSIVPRLKLAQAYQKDGLSDRALDEARRALEIAPNSLPVQQFLTDLDQQTGTSAGTLIRVRAALERSPDSAAAHVSLADALWNSGDLGGAEAEYKAAQALASAGDHAADAQLAQLYAAEARYADCLALLRAGGPGAYALAIQIVKNRTDTLSSTVAASRGTFAAGKSTREQFYDDAKKLSAEAQALAGFVAQVTPPARYKLSHLHRVLSTNLLAQETATLVTSIETDDPQQSRTLALLERAAATEMLTAQAAEEKRGLWKEKQ